jgi:hypothetical protein
MGRIYVVTMDAQTITTAKDFIRLTAPSDAIVVCHEFTISQESTETSDSSAAQIHRTTSTGTGTAFTFTNVNFEVGDPDFGGTAVTNLTVDTSANIIILRREGFNLLNGWHWTPTPEERIILSPSGSIVLRLDVTVASAVMTAEIIFEEIGG